MFTDNHYEEKARKWLLKSFDAVFSHWNEGSNSFYRSSEESKNLLFPTASFRCYSTYENYLQLNDKKIIPESQAEKYQNFNKYITTNGLNKIINESTNVDALKSYVLYERALKCLSLYNKKQKILQLIKNIKKRSSKINSEITVERLLERSQPGSSPYLLLKLVLIIDILRKADPSLIKYFTFGDHFKSSISSEITGYLVKLAENHIDYHMARYPVTEETNFDPPSLAIAVYCRSILDQEWKNTSFFNKCLEVIMNSQTKNGCWPAGISVSFSTNADVVQIPSIEIAGYIADSAIDRAILVNHNSRQEKRLETIMPGLRRTLNYLELTYQTVTKKHGNKEVLFKGWSGDRLGINKHTEAWITSMANRFLFKCWIAEKAYARSSALNKLGHTEFSMKFSGKNECNKFWQEKITETDYQLFPTKKVYSFIEPILNQKDKKLYLCVPESGKVSMILFGPPGSGKTTLAYNMAEVLDWPLLELSPGHFIRNGLEMIESTSKEIFDLLSNVNHAVVLFDECDELFRDRDEKGDPRSARTILSFATASMLTKLQKLHDSKKLIFVLNTNYLYRIDKAVSRSGRFDEKILIDRPDDQARKILIRDRNIAVSEAEADKLAIATRGFSIKEILDICKNNGPKMNTVEEYEKWCTTTGKEELDAAGFISQDKKVILKRWGLMNSGEPDN